MLVAAYIVLAFSLSSQHTSRRSPQVEVDDSVAASLLFVNFVAMSSAQTFEKGNGLPTALGPFGRYSRCGPSHTSAPAGCYFKCQRKMINYIRLSSKQVYKPLNFMQGEFQRRQRKNTILRRRDQSLDRRANEARQHGGASRRRETWTAQQVGTPLRGDRRPKVPARPRDWPVEACWVQPPRPAAGRCRPLKLEGVAFKCWRGANY